MSVMKEILGATGTATRQVPIIDAITHALVGMTYEHHEIHEGDSFSVSDTVAAASATVKWQITTPDTTKYAHLMFELSCTGEATFLVTEGSDRTNGTALEEINRNRVGTPTAATLIVTRTPTGGTTDGTQIIYSRRSGVTGVASKTIEGAATRSQNEWILKPNTKYVISITTYAASMYASILLDWYEHTNRTA